jgi:hypothetical protein
MHENRKFFRIKNQGEIQASIENNSFEVIDISASSIALISRTILPKKGIINIKIHKFSLSVDYELLKQTEQTCILIFPKEEQTELLFPILKNLRNEQNKAK